MSFQFSKHIIEQMLSWNISKDLVHLVLENFDEIIDDQTDVTIYQKAIDGYLYRVFINHKKEPNLIITIYRTSKIRKCES